MLVQVCDCKAFRKLASLTRSKFLNTSFPVEFLAICICKPSYFTELQLASRCSPVRPKLRPVTNFVVCLTLGVAGIHPGVLRLYCQGKKYDMHPCKICAAFFGVPFFQGLSPCGSSALFFLITSSWESLCPGEGTLTSSNRCPKAKAFMQ